MSKETSRIGEIFVQHMFAHIIAAVTQPHSTTVPVSLHEGGHVTQQHYLNMLESRRSDYVTTADYYMVHYMLYQAYSRLFVTRTYAER